MSYIPSRIPDFGKFAEEFREQATAALKEELDRQAERELDRFKRRIRAQAFESFHIVYYPESGTNLSPQWLARKRAAGADLRTAIATSHYVRSLSVRKSTDKRKGVYQVGVGIDPRIKARNLQGEIMPHVTLEHVVEILEYGSLNGDIPPRPHWGPYAQDLRMRARGIALRIGRKVLERLQP